MNVKRNDFLRFMSFGTMGERSFVFLISVTSVSECKGDTTRRQGPIPWYYDRCDLLFICSFEIVKGRQKRFVSFLFIKGREKTDLLLKKLLKDTTL